VHGRVQPLQVRSVVGVPKHREFEPPDRVAARYGRVEARDRLWPSRAKGGARLPPRDVAALMFAGGDEMELLRHRVEEAGGKDRHVIELPNRFSDELIEEFIRLTREILSQPGSRIRVDCQHVDHMTEVAFGAILAAHVQAQRTGGRVMLDARANPRLRRVLRTLGLGPLDDDEGLAGTPSPLTPPPPPRSGQDKREMPRSDEGEQAQ